MDDLVTWLRDQFDDDVRALDEYEQFHAGLPVTTIAIPPGCLLGEPFDSDRQRREVDAKRRILDFFEYERIDVSLPGGPPKTLPGRRPATADPVLRMLALPYADRPGYREEWKP